jgi:hypothetical protein
MFSRLKLAALLISLASTTALANVGAGLEVSKDENRLQNFKYDGRNRFDLGLYDLHQSDTSLYGLSLGYGRSIVDTKYVDVLLGGHINPGVSYRQTNLDNDTNVGAHMFYDLGITPNLCLFNHLRLSAFLGYRKEHGSYYLDQGGLKLDGYITRLGLSLEL